MAAIINVIALVLFMVALCWRIDRLRREGNGLQPIAMTVSIAAITVAFVIQSSAVRKAIDSRLFDGADRVVFYALLATGIAALIVVLCYSAGEGSRRRRAGMEAAPLLVAVVGLNVAMQVTPRSIRTDSISSWSVQNVSFALFFIIGGSYLVYGLTACVISLYRYIRVAEGYLRHALTSMLLGLGMVGIGSLIQTAFVALSCTNVVHAPVLLTIGTFLNGIGLTAFFVGVVYPMVRAKWMQIVGDMRHRRDLRTLAPLWQAVTDVMPAVVLHESDGKSSRSGRAVALRYQRRIVEVRDALVQLSPCLPRDFARSEPADQVDWLEYAMRYYLEHGKTEGAVHEVLPSEGVGIDGDAAPLLRLSTALADSRSTRRDQQTPGLSESSGGSEQVIR